MREVQLYINNKRVDLFNDEEIQVTSTIQNIQDISKTFTDYSQTFTIPCSDNNNSIFDYFYNNDVDGSFKAKERVPARLEINNVPFRSGLVQLEGSEIKNNEANSYKITFYGEVVTLKDAFGEDKLSDLNYSAIAFDYTGANVQDTITNTADLDVRFPLITSDRIWQYNEGATNEDIHLATGAIAFNELFPAVKDKVILDAIESEYGVTFNSNFINSEYFSNSFTYWKNQKEALFTSPPTPALFDLNQPAPYINNNDLQVKYIDPQSFLTPPDTAILGTGYHKLKFYISAPSIYYIDTYKNGVLDNTQNGNGTGTHELVWVLNSQGMNDIYTVQVRFQGDVGTFAGVMTYEFIYQYYDGTSSAYQTGVESWSSPVTSAYINNDLGLNVSAPDITVADWFSGILKQFNLTCFPLDAANTFQVEPVETWYNYGGEINITPYTETDSIKVDRPKLYKRISFEWEKSKSIINEAFDGFFGRQYGSLNNEFPYDGKEFKIKLPFENLLFQKFTNTDLQVAYCTTKTDDGNGYIPKPVKLFLDKTRNTEFYFYDGTNTVLLTNYIPFGQDQYSNLENHSQNFGLDTSTLKDEPIVNSLYKDFYEPYIQNLFNDKTRVVTVKAHLPLTMLAMLTLDDAVILRDKKYRINEMKTNLTSGEVELELLSDWLVQNGQVDFPNEPITGDGGTIIVPVKPVKPIIPTKKFDGGGGYVVIGAPIETSFVTGTPALPATFTGEDTLELVITTNGTGATRYNTLPVTYYNPDGTVISSTVMIIAQKSNDSFLLTEDGGYLLQEDLGRIIL